MSGKSEVVMSVRVPEELAADLRKLASDDDFYEDDEPVEDVIAAFEAGEKRKTRPPEGWTGLVRVEIDPNIRVRGGQTLADFGDADGPLAVGQAVRVFESEAGIAGDGVVTEIDEQKRLIFLRIDWPSLRPEES